MSAAQSPLRPASVCAALLAALEAADGRTRSRKRDQTPDRIGLRAKRALLAHAVADDPEPQSFEAWLMQYVLVNEAIAGMTLAVARAVLDEWRLAHELPAFAAWLAQGAPSADANAGTEVQSRAMHTSMEVG